MSTATLKYFPWIGPDERVSPLKLAVFALLFLPGLWVAYELSHGMLGPRPLNQATHEIGQWTIRLIFLSLAITPFRQILRWPELLLVRRMIGVAAAVYILIHLFLYTADENFNLAKVASEIYLRIYLTIGFTALLGLVILAATSTDAIIARLGSRNWRRLHQAIYAITILGIIHFYMQAKADVWEPMWMTGLFVWLMAYRVVQWTRKRRGPLSLLWLIGLTIFATAFTAVGEAIYFWIATGVDPLMVLAANLGTLAGIRPSWIVGGAGLAVVAIAAVTSWARKRPRSPSIAPISAVAEIGRSQSH
jgi:sulfoxide reductase heme-binding subunit YedZ